MATIDTLASLHSVPRTNLLVLIIEGLTPSGEYRIYRHRSDEIETEVCAATEEEFDDVFTHKVDFPSYWTGVQTADANGRIIKFWQNFTADDSMNDNGGGAEGNPGLTIHDNTDPGNGYNVQCKTNNECLRSPADRRLDGDVGFLFSTTSTLAALDPWYVEVSNLVATPGVGEVDLAWDAGTKLDAGRGSIEYSVLRRNAAGDPGPSDILVSGLTTTSYTDTTPANGVAYKYRIHARLYWSGFEPYDADGYLPYDSFWGGLDMSNIEEVTLGEVAPFTVSMNVRVPMKAP